MDVSIQLTSRTFDLGPDGGEGAVGEFGQGGIADGPAADFRGAIGEECGLAPGHAFVAGSAKVQWKAQRRGAGIVGEDERAIAGAKQVRGTRDPR